MKKIIMIKDATEKKISFQVLKFSKTWKEGLSGIGVVELILILVVLIGLVLIFKSQLTNILNSLFRSIKSDIKSI